MCWFGEVVFFMCVYHIGEYFMDRKENIQILSVRNCYEK